MHSSLSTGAQFSAPREKLEQLLQSRSDIWRAHNLAAHRSTLATGFADLDVALHDGGWPLGASTELLSSGLNWPLLMPALTKRLPGYILLIDPPLMPSALYLAQQGLVPEQVLVLRPMSLHENLWAADQALRAGCCALVCHWLPDKGVTDRDLRQLQQAAGKGDSWHVLLRSARVAQSAAPAALRLQLEIVDSGLQLTVLKQRGGWAGQQVRLSLWPELAAQTCPAVDAWPVHLESLPALRQRKPLKRPVLLASLVNI